jgi:hypothetical protein
MTRPDLRAAHADGLVLPRWVQEIPNESWHLTKLTSE